MIASSTVSDARWSARSTASSCPVVPGHRCHRQLQRPRPKHPLTLSTFHQLTT
jgi:hypothetical protein